MPGHTVAGKDQHSFLFLILFDTMTFFSSIESIVDKVKEDVNLLHDLIRQHDVVFLLTDSRESRWLPTVLASVEQKVCLYFFDNEQQ